MTVGDICTKPVATARAEETVADAAVRMRDRHVGDLVVVDTQGRPAGILTDRDIVVNGAARGLARLEATTVGEIMSRELVTALGSETIEQALTKMQQRGIRRLPVVSTDGRLVGLLAFDDVIENMSSELNQLVNLVAHEQKREEWSTEAVAT
jgi:CBS domain-containing protein